MAKITPMMEQYFEIKNNYKYCLLFYRVGDFYEMFFDDAIIASRELEITLTGKSWGQDERAPMCGVPFHSADSYITRLVEKGYNPYANQKLASITELTKRLGGKDKFNELCGGYVVLQEGTIALVPNTDSREEINIKEGDN